MATHKTPAPLHSHSHSQRWILAHDIRDPRRLQRVWRYLSRQGVRLQYSVYLLSGTHLQMDKLLADLRLLIDETADDVRLYPLTENTRIWGLGKQFDDDGNTLTDALVDKMIQPDTDLAREKIGLSKLSF